MTPSSGADTDDGFDQRYSLFQQAWQQADAGDRRRRAQRWGWAKRWTWCWWRHRTRNVGPGAYVSHACWACANHTRLRLHVGG